MPTDATQVTTVRHATKSKARPDFLLLAVCVLALLPRLYLGLTQFIEYDGYWHVFIAQQDNWGNFWQEYMTNDHPLLFYLLLKVLVHLGRSVLLYRSIPIASGVASVYLVGRIVQKVSATRFAAPVAALAFGLAMPCIEISISVRSYMLSIFFVLLSFSYFLDMLPWGEIPPSRRTRILFALSTMLAVSSHYFAFLYVAACGLVLLGYSVARRSFAWKTWLAHVLTFLPVIGVMAYFYFTHIRYNATNMSHLTTYLFQGNESSLQFFVRNLQNLYNFFAPYPVASLPLFEAVAAVLAVAAIGATTLARARGAAPLLMFLTILAEVVAAAFLGRYPFGGYLRQQFILFPFAILSVGVCLDGLFSVIRVRRVVVSVAVLAAAGIIAVSADRIEAYPKLYQELFTREMNLFRYYVPEPDAVYTDQFNLIAFFTHYHQWRWKFVEKLPVPTPVDEYSLRLGRQRMELLRDKTRWNLDFLEPALYLDLANGIRAARLHSLAVFCIHQVPGARTLEEQETFRRQVSALAAAEHLQIRQFVSDGLNVYAEFSLAGAVPAPPR